jgi:molybdopterin molybdotransferase
LYGPGVSTTASGCSLPAGAYTSGAIRVRQVDAAGNQGSGVLRSMVEANGLIVLHHHQSNVAAGDELDVMMFEGAI